MRQKILDILRSSDGYVSGEEISRRLSISRTAVWKHINALRSGGCEISSVTNKGYRLERGDILAPDEIRRFLKTKLIGSNIVCLAETDSTNNECKRQPQLSDGTVIAAERQSNGRGRRGNTWISPNGGAWFSILLKPAISPRYVSGITLAAGLAVCRAIGCGAKIKYPNDIVIGTKKVCGILTELSAEENEVNYVVCGIGVNISQTEFPGQLSERATSVFAETGENVDRTEMIARILNEFELLYYEFLQSGAEGYIDEYRRHCVTIGSEVTAAYGGKSIRGVCTGVNADGSIDIKTEAGTVNINSGEVSVRGIYGYV